MFNERTRADSHRRKLLALWDRVGIRPLPQGLEEFIKSVASALAMRDRMIHDLLQEGVVDSPRDSRATPPPPATETPCQVCGHDYGLHAEAFNLDPLTHRLSNCAKNVGLPQSECPICIPGILDCPEPHRFRKPDYK